MLAEDEIINEISKTEYIIQNIIGVDPKPIIRFPYGSFNTTVLKVAGSMGYMYSILWSIDPRDWELPPSDTIVKRILNHISNGAIILLHNHGAGTAAAFDIFIPALKEQQYEFITVGS